MATTVNTAALPCYGDLTGLTSATAYEYQLTDGEISIAKVEFTTETEIVYKMEIWMLGQKSRLRLYLLIVRRILNLGQVIPSQYNN